MEVNTDRLPVVVENGKQHTFQVNCTNHSMFKYFSNLKKNHTWNFSCGLKYYGSPSCTKPKTNPILTTTHTPTANPNSPYLKTCPYPTLNINPNFNPNLITTLPPNLYHDPNPNGYPCPYRNPRLDQTPSQFQLQSQQFFISDTI